MDECSLPPVENRELLVEAMGAWPTFHDAHVLSASRDGERCEALLYVFRMTNQVDDRGYFVLTDHHRVSLAMIGVSECSLSANYESDILFELRIQGFGGNMTVEFDSVVDQSWHVRCQKVRLSDVVPCGPGGEPAI